MADKGKKVGRNKAQCATYKANNTRAFNKARRIIRHLKHHPFNLAAVADLKRIGNTLYSAQRSKLNLSAWSA